MNPTLRKWLQPFATLKLTIFCLSTLMGLVLLCTLAQVHLGIFGAVDKYIRSLFITIEIPSLGWKIPVLPGGGFIGILLLINLIATFANRFRFNKKKFGIWMIHSGIILFVLGEFVTGFFQVETHMAIEEGQTKNYTENSRDLELAIVDISPEDHDQVFSIPESRLHQKTEIRVPQLPFTLLVKRYYPSSFLEKRQNTESDLPSLANVGVGTKISVRPAPPVTRDDQRDLASAYVELIDQDRSLGTWLFSNAIEAPQGFNYQGRDYQISLRPKRHYFPYTFTLKDFRHDIYPGTEIPKNFSSLIHLNHPEKGEQRDVLIYMNHPFRYDGKAFFQASFGKNDTLSVLQVVSNPGWLLPYIAFAIVTLGLLYQFIMRFFNFTKENQKALSSPTTNEETE